MQLPLHFRTDACYQKLREDLSAAYLGPDGYLWLASDELLTLERLKWDGAQFGEHESFSLLNFFNLPGGADGEIDIEGLTFADNYLWLVGSHSRKLRKPKANTSDTKNIQRLTWKKTQTEPNRYLLGRIPLIGGKLESTVSNPAQPDANLTAAALAMSDDGNPLVEALKRDPHIGPYVKAGIPGKANGLDIEGLEMIGHRLLLGLRGPVLLDWAILLAVELKAKQDGTLALKKIGPDDQPYRKYFVNLRGLGVRDLCQFGDDLLILAGPTQYLDGPSQVYRLRAADQLDDKVMYRPEMILDIPCGVGKEQPESITLATAIVAEPALLVIYDAPQEGRKREPNAVLADVFPVSLR